MTLPTDGSSILRMAQLDLPSDRRSAGLLKHQFDNLDQMRNRLHIEEGRTLSPFTTPSSYLIQGQRF